MDGWVDIIVFIVLFGFVIIFNILGGNLVLLVIFLSIIVFNGV